MYGVSRSMRAWLVVRLFLARRLLVPMEIACAQSAVLAYLALDRIFPRRVHAVLHGLDDLPHSLQAALTFMSASRMSPMAMTASKRPRMPSASLPKSDGSMTISPPSEMIFFVLFLEGAERLGSLGGGASAILHPLAGVLVEGVLALSWLMLSSIAATAFRWPPGCGAGRWGGGASGTERLHGG